MEKFKTLLKTDTVAVYVRDFGNGHTNMFDVVKIEKGLTKTFLSTFTLDMNEVEYTNRSIVDVVEYYHVTRFYDLDITEFSNMESALKTMERWSF